MLAVFIALVSIGCIGGGSDETAGVTYSDKAVSEAMADLNETFQNRLYTVQYFQGKNKTREMVSEFGFNNFEWLYNKANENPSENAIPIVLFNYMGSAEAAAALKLEKTTSSEIEGKAKDAYPVAINFAEKIAKSDFENYFNQQMSEWYWRIGSNYTLGYNKSIEVTELEFKKAIKRAAEIGYDYIQFTKTKALEYYSAGDYDRALMYSIELTCYGKFVFPSDSVYSSFCSR
jgi:hypothetical protein